MEIELKLVGREADLVRLGRLPLVREARIGRAQTRLLHSVYYDTIDHDLAARGMALRLRRVGSQWVQTFKCGGAVEAGLHQRHEFEAPATAQLLNVQALLATPAADLFADARFRDALHPVFTTEFRRTRWNVAVGPGSIAELALDLGRITADERSEPVHEIEIELLEGDAAHLLGFAHALLDALPLRLENASKAERGYSLQAARARAPARATPPALEPKSSVADGFHAIAASCAGQLLGNDRGVMESDDPEYIHQARVAIRRLRSAFSLFRSFVPRESLGDLPDRFRALAEVLGTARDWDVFVTETLPPVYDRLGDVPGLAAIGTRAAALGAERRVEARAAIAAPAYGHLLLDFLARLRARPWAVDGDAPAAGDLRGCARAVLRRQHKRVRRRGKAADRRDAASLHALRIEIKKLRYAVEFLAPIFPAKAVRRFVRGTADLQDILGRLNDEAVTDRLLQSLGDTDAELSHATGIVRGWAHARAEAGLARFDAAWRAFEKLDPFW
jgi:inorganic triphosphatase YgiF